jgi:hypothetical protein
VEETGEFEWEKRHPSSSRYLTQQFTGAIEKAGGLGSGFREN